MDGLPVTVRTLDLGADKHLNGVQRFSPNPALGLRAIRLCLAEPQMFHRQLRAILRASHYGKIRILVPMLSTVHELNQTLHLIGEAKRSLDEDGIAYDRDIQVGGMIEVPAAALSLGAFMRAPGFPLDRHQRPDPVHARHRPHRRRGGAPVRPAASGGAACWWRRSSAARRRPASRWRCAARWPAT